MSYTTTQAQSGKGSVLSIGIGSTPTYTVVGEVTSVDFSGNSAQTSDSTNFQSANFREFIATIIDSGTVKLTGNRVAADAGQVLVSSNFQSLTTVAWKLVLPLSKSQTTTGDTITWLGLIQSDEFSVSVDKSITFAITLKVSGPITTVPGS